MTVSFFLMDPKRKNWLSFKFLEKFLWNEMFTDEDYFNRLKILLFKILSFLQQEQQTRYGDEGAGDKEVVPTQVFG